MKNCKECNFNFFQRLIACRNCKDVKIVAIHQNKGSKELQEDLKVNEDWANEYYINKVNAEIYKAGIEDATKRMEEHDEK